MRLPACTLIQEAAFRFFTTFATLGKYPTEILLRW